MHVENLMPTFMAIKLTDEFGLTKAEYRLTRTLLEQGRMVEAFEIVRKRRIKDLRCLRQTLSAIK